MGIKLGKGRNVILLSLILLFALALRLIFFSGIDASDSLFYTKFAYEFLKGNINFNESHLASRLGMIYPVSLLYKYSGVNELSSNIIVLLASLSSIILVYKFGKFLFSENVGLLSAFLLSLFPLDIVYSTRLLPDVPSAFFVALSVYFFLKSEKMDKKTVSDMYCLFSGLSLGIAYLIKELSLLIGLFFIAYIAYKRQIRKRYFLIALGFALVFFIEVIYFLKLTGNPFFRLSAGKSEWDAIILETNFYGRTGISGLFHYPYVIFTDNLITVFYIFIFIAAAYCIINKKKGSYPLLFWFLPLLLYLSFGSASLTRYIPIPATSRFLVMITIPGMLILSFFLTQNEPSIRKVLMPSIVILLFFTSIGYVYISELRFSLSNERSAYTYLKSLPSKQVYTDERTLMIFNYLSSYKGNNNIKSFQHYEFLKPEDTYALNLSQVKDSYVVVNWRLVNFLESSKKGIKFPDDIYHVPKNWVLKKEIGKKGKDDIMVYYAS